MPPSASKCGPDCLSKKKNVHISVYMDTLFVFGGFFDIWDQSDENCVQKHILIK